MKSATYKWLVFICISLVGFNAVSAVQSNVKGESKLGGDFQLTDHNGQLFDLKDERGKVILIFFGYTSCPDICPMELSLLSRLLGLLKEDSKKVKVLFISVDPERDTPKILKQYVSYFNPQVVGLTGSIEQIAKVSEQYHALNNVAADADKNANYTVSHSGNIYMVDGKGLLTNIVPFGIPIEHVQRLVNVQLKLIDSD